MIKASTAREVDVLIQRYPALEVCRDDLLQAVELICDAYHAGKKVIICGNGGSAADAEHIVGELMKGFVLKRPMPESMRARFQEICPNEADYFMKYMQGTLPAMSLANQVALNTAYANDQAPNLVFAQQVLGMGNEGDVLIAISTSGTSINIYYAVQMARVKKVKVLAMTGQSGGTIKDLADVCVKAPTPITHEVQEYHLPIYHMFCIAAENEFFGKD